MFPDIFQISHSLPALPYQSYRWLLLLLRAFQTYFGKCYKVPPPLYNEQTFYDLLLIPILQTFFLYLSLVYTPANTDSDLHISRHTKNTSQVAVGFCPHWNCTINRYLTISGSIIITKLYLRHVFPNHTAT